VSAAQTSRPAELPLTRTSFVLYQLRTSYLSHIKDGVGDRLITVNSNILNNPTFRAAGWAPNTSDIKRTYSPPIPTAITAEYFQAPYRAAGQGVTFNDEEEEEGGMVTGGAGSNETVGPNLNAKRRRRREQLEDGDSTDLSEESDDEPQDEARKAVHQIKFSKVPVRQRAGSSPLRTGPLDGPSLMVTSPSKPTESGLRRGSLGAVEAVKARARRDTATSSEMSSENELDPSLFQRKQVNPRRAAKASHLLSERIQEDEREGDEEIPSRDAEEDSDSSLSSAFAESADSNSMLDDVLTSLPKLPGVPQTSTPSNLSPRRFKQPPAPAMLQALPPPRPISVMIPVSALTQALKAKDKVPVSPFERFATLSAKADPNPLYIKIFVPSSAKPTTPFEMLLRKVPDGGGSVTVADAIGFALYRYNELGLQPGITSAKMNVNKWNFRMVEDEEVDYDFPALTRVRPISDFTSNNNRGVRGRSREKPWDEFALVEANDAEFRDNEASTPIYSKQAKEAMEASAAPSAPATPAAAPLPQKPPQPPAPPASILGPFRHPITGPYFAAPAARKDSAPLDAPAVQTSHATPRTGPPKLLTIHYMDDNFLTRTTQIEVTTDTYIAEVFDQVCKRFNVDKGLYVLKVHATSTVAPSDRTVEALGDRSDLDLAKRRFIGDGAFGLSGSPGSSSPNAPLLIASGGTPKKGKRTVYPTTTLAAARQDALLAAAGGGSLGTYKRYAVIRKQPMSFSSSSARILAFDGEYMHIMPAESGTAHVPGGGAAAGAGARGLFEAPQKVTTVHFSSVVGSKVSRRHPRMFSFGVYKERETKRYDFEAQTQSEAAEIVGEIKKGVERVQEVGL
jgi:target of rapamycin complex 2 subunit MAPKAP1